MARIGVGLPGPFFVTAALPSFGMLVLCYLVAKFWVVALVLLVLTFLVLLCVELAKH